MAVYTMELHSLIERGYNIFDDTWDTFVPEHKPELCDKILRHYWFYEIGQETPDRFKHYLNEHLALIMPYYNQLYRSELEKIIPLYNQFITGADNLDRRLTNDLTKVDKRDTISMRQIAKSLQRLMNAEAEQTRNLGTTDNRDWEEHKIGSENVDENETRDTDVSTDRDTTEKTDSSSTKDVTGKETYQETINGIQDGTKDTTAHSATTTGSTRLYSDTPQATITSQGMSINEEYLTNYTRESGNQTVDSTGKETVHNQEDKTTNSTKDTTENTQETSTKDVSGTMDETQNTDETITKNKDRTWKEDSTGTDDRTGKEDETTKDTESATTNEYENGSVQDNGSAIGSSSEAEKRKEDVDRKTHTFGFTTSQSELLREWRKTFLNIDAEIIRKLGVNFMGVF